jgi:RsiW-degrading membrane proteinase PrsW (M82 family)
VEFFIKIINFFTIQNFVLFFQENWKAIIEADKVHLTLAFFSVLPWGFTVWYFQPCSKVRKFFLTLGAIFLGILSTKLILALHPILWPDINFKPRKTTILAQTVYISFIQAGMMEETFKVLLILAFSYIVAFERKTKTWMKDVVLIGAFVALGFSFIENYVYIHKENNAKMVFTMFLGRTIYSSNIHLLINLCFALFLYKSNFKHTTKEKIFYLLYAYFLAILQHGIVDFFLLPSSRFGNWLATAFFVGIWVWVARDLRKYIYAYEISIPEVQDKEINYLEESNLQIEDTYKKYLPN